MKVNLNKLIALFVISLIFYCFSFCKSVQSAEKISHNIPLWHYYSKDTVVLSFKLDSVYKSIECSGYEFDDGAYCVAYGGEKIGIYIRVYPLKKGSFVEEENLTEAAESIIFKIKEAYLDRSVQKPEIISSDFLEGIVVKSSRENINSINYVGYDRNMLMEFNIVIEPVDSSINTNQLFSDFIQSFSVRVKK